MRSLIVGDGYVAATLAEQLRHRGVSVEQAPRPDRPALDRLLAAQEVDQVVLAPCAKGSHADGFVHCVDGPRWAVCSWATGTVASNPSVTDVVLERGGTMLSLSGIFGRGGDDNVTRFARSLRRYRALVGVGNGERLVQPLHVDDLVGLVGLHLRRPVTGCFEIAGPEVVPVAELCQSIVEIIGLPPIAHVTAPIVRVLGRRSPRSQAAIDWRDGHAPVDTHPARAQFGWTPVALGIRVEQAVHEALA